MSKLVTDKNVSNIDQQELNSDRDSLRLIPWEARWRLSHAQWAAAEKSREEQEGEKEESTS